MGRKCPICGAKMVRYENPDRLICVNIKAHDKARKNTLGKLGVAKGKKIRQTKPRKKKNK